MLCIFNPQHLCAEPILGSQAPGCRNISGAPHMGVVILPTPPLYKCFYGNDSTTEMLPPQSLHYPGILTWSLNNKQHTGREAEYFIGTWRGASLMDTERASVRESVRKTPRHTTDMIRDCRHNTGNGQRLQTWYRRQSETADCRHGTEDDQRLQT